MASQSDLADALLEQTHTLVGIPSVSGSETQIADYLESQLNAIQHLQVTRIENNLIARTEFKKNQRLLIGGHTDTVPHPDSFQPQKTKKVVSGPGAVDMKGGLAIMLELARYTLQNSQGGQDGQAQNDLSFVFYASEEVELEKNGLRQIEKSNPELLTADAAILMEPTGGAIEAGCQGSMKVQLSLLGARAHTARAWKGKNAIHRLAPVLTAVQEYIPRTPVIEGCKFHEAIQVVSIEGGVAGNVVPDQVDVLFNLRIAPDKTNDQALTELKELIQKALGDQIKADTLIVKDSVEPAMPSLSHPLLKGLVSEVGEVKAKLGWTDVAFFYQKNVPALNFGPGDAELSHTQEEEVSGKELVEVFEKLTTTVLRH